MGAGTQTSHQLQQQEGQSPVCQELLPTTQRLPSWESNPIPHTACCGGSWKQQGRKPALSLLGWGPETLPPTQGHTPYTLTAVPPPPHLQGWASSVRYPWQDGASSLRCLPPWQGCVSCSGISWMPPATGSSLSDTSAPGRGQQGPSSWQADLTSLLHETEQVIQELLPLGVCIQFVEL